ncbi:MAG: large subunit ribosomal protein L28 [Bacteroidetes bacterium]|nr:MAG: large subunit ribosomal protein L28 [Bacteroidota bacterium]
MSKVCQITGKKSIGGNKVSHSNRKTKRRFNVNLHAKRFFLPEENKWLQLRISTAGMRTINKIGISEAVKRAREAGYLAK